MTHERSKEVLAAITRAFEAARAQGSATVSKTAPALSERCKPLIEAALASPVIRAQRTNHRSTLTEKSFFVGDLNGQPTLDAILKELGE